MDENYPMRPNKGGKRKGAGRKRVLEFEKRREIANDYCSRIRASGLRREAVIRELMGAHDVTHRMVERCLGEFHPEVRWNKKIFEYATDGMNEIERLPNEEIAVNKLKPGIYADDKLRLVIDDGGKRKWIFPFLWPPDPRQRTYPSHSYREMVLGGSEMSLERARTAADKASRTLKYGQNPIDGSWASPALQAAAPLRGNKWR